MKTKNTIHIYDFDGTLVDSNPITKECRVVGLVKLTGKPRSQIERELPEKDMEGILEEHNAGLKEQDRVSVGDFLKTKNGYYRSFDPYEAKRQGKFQIFPDAKEVLESRRGEPNVVISNSSIDATNKKIDALNMAHYFNHVFAEFEKGKAKPSLHMGEKALDELSKEGALASNPRIVLVGDEERDLQFGESFKHLYKNSVNLLVDREGTYNRETRLDGVVKSLTQLARYE